MKKILLAGASLALFAAGSAFAADLPSRKAPPPVYVPPPPPPAWTGFYLGANFGGGWLANNSSNAGWGWNGGGGGSGGVLGGVQLGYNYQFSPMFVVGAEADWQGTSIGSSGGQSVVLLPNGWGFVTAGSARVDWFGTVRGRAGVTALMPNLLIYGTGGFAYGEVRRNGGWSQNSTVQTGWTAGGGLEWMFWPNWSAKAEYLYTDISGGNNNGFNFGLGLNNVNNHTRFHTVRAGVNYHFNFGGPPVIARY